MPFWTAEAPGPCDDSRRKVDGLTPMPWLARRLISPSWYLFYPYPVSGRQLLWIDLWPYASGALMDEPNSMIIRDRSGLRTCRALLDSSWVASVMHLPWGLSFCCGWDWNPMRGRREKRWRDGRKNKGHPHLTLSTFAPCSPGRPFSRGPTSCLTGSYRSPPPAHALGKILSRRTKTETHPTGWSESQLDVRGYVDRITAVTAAVRSLHWASW